MVERRVTVGWAEGLHARPASIFVRAATAAGVPVTIARAASDAAGPVNAASMLAVLSLGAKGGEEVVLASDAEDATQAEAALDRLARLVAEGLEELPETV